MSEAKPYSRSNLEPHASAIDEAQWCQVKETVLMLDLAIAQITGALNDGDDSVSNLVESFTNMSNKVESTLQAASSLPDSKEKSTIVNNGTSVANDMHQAIIAIQFYDKLTQQLTHVSTNLDVLAGLVSNPDKLHDPDEWQGLKDKIKSNYTVESERLMFDYILQGHSVEEALAMAKQIQKDGHDEADDIELF